MSGQGIAPIALEMGYSVDEFVRVLPGAMRDWRVSGGPLQWRVLDELGCIDVGIDLSPLAERQLGALSVPVLAVTISPRPPTSTASMQEFMRRFERGFRRGGG